MVLQTTNTDMKKVRGVGSPFQKFVYVCKYENKYIVKVASFLFSVNTVYRWY